MHKNSKMPDLRTVLGKQPFVFYFFRHSVWPALIVNKVKRIIINNKIAVFSSSQKT